MIVTALFVWQGWQGFNLYDEGFLWYGAQRVAAGEVPLRDFQSYDPGRYYWSAAVMMLSGDTGIIVLRAAAAAFQAAGLSLALLIILGSGGIRNLPLTLLAAVTLSIWMYPRHKLFDITVSIALIAAFAHLVGKPTTRSCFVAGIVVGIAAVVGRNHGVYGVAAGLCIFAYLAAGTRGFRLLSGFKAWAAGIAVGYVPILAMVAFTPGFANALWQSILFLFEIKATNLPLPVPWPWLVMIDPEFPTATARELLTGLFFIAAVAFAIAGIAFVMRRASQRRPASPELVSCAFLSLPYAHFAFSRPDLSHLAQAIFPLLIGSFVAMRGLHGFVRWPLALVITAASLFVMLPQQPGWACRVVYECSETEVAGSVLNVDHRTADSLRILKELVGKFAPDGRSFVATPFWPAAYAIFGRKSPTFEIFALFPRSEAFQLKEIEQIKKADPGFVLVWDYALDGNEHLRFRNTHPLVDRFFRDNFDRLPESGQSPEYEIYKAR